MQPFRSAGADGQLMGAPPEALTEQKRVGLRPYPGNIKKENLKMRMMRKAFSILAILALFAIPALSQTSDEEVVAAMVTLPEAVELSILPLTATWSTLGAPASEDNWVLFDENLLELTVAFQSGETGVVLTTRMDSLANAGYFQVPSKFRVTINGEAPIVMSDAPQTLKPVYDIGGNYLWPVTLEYNNRGKSKMGNYYGNIYFTLTII